MKNALPIDNSKRHTDVSPTCLLYTYCLIDMSSYFHYLQIYCWNLCTYISTYKVEVLL